MNEKQYYQLSGKQKGYGKVKLVIDTVMAIGGTVILSPVFLGIVIASLLSMKGQKNIENMCPGVVGAFFFAIFGSLNHVFVPIITNGRYNKYLMVWGVKLPDP